MLNSRFHARITRIGGNEVLEELIARLDKRIRWFFAPVVKSRGSSSWKEHLEIVEAIAARDPERASEAMRRHAEKTRDAYFREETPGATGETKDLPAPPS
jgi:DNA-binding GntR family transcriptional regulator